MINCSLKLQTFFFLPTQTHFLGQYPALDFRNPIKQWLRESIDKGGNHTDLAVVGPGDELTGSVFHHTQHLNERIAGFPARPRQGIIHP